MYAEQFPYMYRLLLPPQRLCFCLHVFVGLSVYLSESMILETLSMNVDEILRKDGACDWQQMVGFWRLSYSRCGFGFFFKVTIAGQGVS